MAYQIKTNFNSNKSKHMRHCYVTYFPLDITNEKLMFNNKLIM